MVNSPYFYIQDGFLAAIIQIKVVPNASRNKIEGWQEKILRVRIKAVPDKGKANEALIAFLSKELGVAKSRLSIVSGQTARLKRMAVEGLTMEEIETLLAR